MIENELLNLMANYGFPIALSIYLLITRDKTISQNTEALKELKEVIKEHCKT